jgi:hypothetical protein
MKLSRKVEDIFKPASKPELTQRRKDYIFGQEDLDEIDVIRDLFEENHSRGRKVSDEEWFATIKELLASSGKTIQDLKDFNDNILQLLIALDDANIKSRENFQ